MLVCQSRPVFLTPFVLDHFIASVHVLRYKSCLTKTTQEIRFVREPSNNGVIS